MKPNFNLSMDETFRNLFPTVLSSPRLGKVFNSGEFIVEFKLMYAPVYNDFLEKKGKQLLHMRIGWVLSKYSNNFNVVKIGKKNNQTQWRNQNRK